jgi:hypothetical protein
MENIQCAIELSRQLLSCADIGDLAREDDSCGVLYGIVRDSAYKIIKAAERERLRHIERGTEAEVPRH